MASSDLFAGIKTYRNTLAHRQVLARALSSPTSAYASDLVPSNPAAHPSEWELNVPYGALTQERLALLQQWFASATTAFASFVQNAVVTAVGSGSR